MGTAIWNFIKSIIGMSEDLRRQSVETKEMRQELRDLTIIVHALAQEIRHTKELAAGERVNVLLEVENRLLNFEKRLPPAKNEKD